MHEKLEQDRLFIAVDILILTEKGGSLKLLLSRRSHAPCKDQWALPGRFVALEESAEETVSRLLAEMLPVERHYSEQLYTFTRPERDKRGRVVSIAYLVIVPWQHLEKALQQEDARMTCFSVGFGGEGCRLTFPDGTPLPEEALAFDHAAIIRTGLARLQGKIDYTDVAFRFLNAPEAFSLSELQRIFEAVQGRAQDASNFRRFVRSRWEDAGRIRPAAITEKKGRGRPAVLYSWQA